MNPSIINDAPLYQYCDDVPGGLDVPAPKLNTIKKPRSDQPEEKDPERHVADDFGIELLAPSTLQQASHVDETKASTSMAPYPKTLTPPKIGIVNKTCRIRRPILTLIREWPCGDEEWPWATP